MEAIEGNKIIAEWMGATFNAENSRWTFPIQPTSYYRDDATHVTLRYDSDWNWIMPVVEKIQSIDITPAPNYKGYRIEIVVGGYVKINGFPMPPIFINVSVEGNLITAIWKAVVSFIEWHNNLKKV